MFYVYMPKFHHNWLILSLSGGEKPQILPFLDFSILCCHQLKVKHVFTTTNLPLLSNGIKIVSVLQHLHGEIVQTNCDVQKCDWQTNKKLDVLATPVAGKIRALPNLVIEDLEHILAPLKLSGVRHIVLMLGSTKNLGETHPLNLKPM